MGGVSRVEVADFPADPYPGAWPEQSFTALDGGGLRLQVGELPPDGVPVLAYGSNRCPGKIGWLRTALGLAGDVTVLAADTTDLAAVWASGFRLRDGARPATLAARPGATERHAVWWATPDQLAVLDVCEARGVNYRRVRLHTGTVRTAEAGVLVALTYVGLGPQRMPLLIDGSPVLCADVDQARARELTGVAATEDGLRVTAA